jgi:hypothetical protein
VNSSALGYGGIIHHEETKSKDASTRIHVCCTAQSVLCQATCPSHRKNLQQYQEAETLVQCQGRKPPQ